MLIPMAIIVLEVVALIFQRIECLIFDAPPRSPAPHELIPGAFIDAQVGDPAKVLDRVPVSLPTLQEVDPQIGMRFIERHVTDKAKPVAQTRLAVLPIAIPDAARSPGRRPALQPAAMVT